jgi:hypothetical protein
MTNSSDLRSVIAALAGVSAPVGHAFAQSGSAHLAHTLMEKAPSTPAYPFTRRAALPLPAELRTIRLQAYMQLKQPMH